MAAETFVSMFVPAAVTFDFGSVFGFALEFELFEVVVVVAVAALLFDSVFDFAVMPFAGTFAADNCSGFQL